MRAWYTTVEKVMRASDVKASAYVADEIGAAIESASEAIDKLCTLGDVTRPAFAPWTGTIAFDWPFANNNDAYRFWLNQFRLHTLVSMSSGGIDITSSALGWPTYGPPFSGIDIDTAGSGSLEIGASGTGQRSLSIAGVWGTLGQDQARSGWTLGASASSSDSDLTINAPIGIGSILLIDGERLFVSGRSWVDSGQTASALTANVASQSVQVASGALFLAGEEITIDAEIMLIRSIIGNTLVVQRAASGSVLAEHLVGAPVYWARQATVERGMLGTSATSHSNGAAISIYRPPSLVEQLAIAYAIDRRAQENVGYARDLGHIQDRRTLAARKVGGDTGAVGVAALEDRVIAAYGRIRHRAI